MHVTILTPLFPPDTGAPAPYAKLLAARLATENTTVISYGRLPEAVPGVQIQSIPKHGFKFLLLFRCLHILRRTDSDLLLINNGPSAELPALLYSFFTQTPLALIMSDPRAQAASDSGVYKIIHRLLRTRCAAVVHLPADLREYLPEEKLPFSESIPADHTNWWTEHIHTLLSYAH